jgi:hypothetical protein
MESERDAVAVLNGALRPDEPFEPVPPSVKRRCAQLKDVNKRAGEHFKLLTGTTTHVPALLAIGEVYPAMPSPDDNFVSDFQTANFDSRLFELYLLAVFRQQGIRVSQNQVSPDFHIERERHECFVEAVTTNPKDVRIQGYTLPTFASEAREHRLLGSPAARFAKTLRSKLQRAYEKLPHVQGKPFALAIADFHAPSSMVWRGEALPSYLYGVFPRVAKGTEGPSAVATSVKTLLNESHIPAGLFRDPKMSYLSGVIFSNAATLGKFNRMGFLAGCRPKGLRMVRDGILFDRTPGALQAIPFKLDILSDEYAALWDGG